MTDIKLNVNLKYEFLEKYGDLIMPFDERELTFIVDGLGVGIYLADSKGVTLWVNKVFEDISLIKKEEVVGKTLGELVDTKYFSNSATLSVMQTNKPITVSFDTKTGKKLLSQGKPLFDQNGRLKYIVNTIYDLSSILTPQNEESYQYSLFNDYNIVAQSEKMLRVSSIAIKASNIDLPVLICGETGVGKELIAKLIHYAGIRKNKTFISLNCAAIPESLIESELFGYEPGSFTGSDKKGKKGIFELTDKGTVLLDEIGEMPLSSQAKLLRFLEQKEFIKLGGTRLTKVDVRVIAATNKDLKKLILEGRFRKDLYYRLSAITIYVPPLRERLDDIDILVNFFLNNLNEIYKTKKSILPDVIELIKTLSLDGNVRELKNIIERLYFYSINDIITLDDFYQNIGQNRINEIIISENSLKDELEAYEKSILEKYYKQYHSTRKLARFLKISQTSAFKKLKKYNII
ncbi:Two component, sigma54 specific, transcriptional regulator, Fis family [Desulfurella amilsii]|uniref:HTH-type transcriptional regulatory protein TyrR n=1 Tax=Desulfurella amilsii TaxID=1562698 RepID=A0A1X4XUQ3_9BACT|nr:sigma 54-interacting transcriptional regulator [Desulfurella amilsii]OSS41238.1 Two component, sigma54 specific, transcriptional regulator, Fis family [Desulfurella amilsii]